MEEENALIDSNILIYTYSEDSSKRAASMELLQQCLMGKRRFFVALQNIGEFCSVSMKKYKLEPDKVNAITQALLKSENFLKVHYRESTFYTAINLAKGLNLKFWDAMLAATMLENGVSTIYTENTKDFKMPGIKAINPFLRQ